MANICLMCAKKSMVGGRYSNRVRATKFNPVGSVRRYPNLQWATTTSGTRIKICTRCIKAGKHLKATQAK
jgi:ribosomal protein L28